MMLNNRQIREEVEFGQSEQWSSGDFQTLKILGRGKFGEVKVAREISSDYIVALKTMSRVEIDQNNYTEQVKREIIIQSALDHPNILKLYGYFWNCSSVVLVLEYAPKGQLYAHLKKAGRFSQDVVAAIIFQICQGLSYLHRHCVIHRDIKPQNILISGNSIKIADFGWAVASHSRRTTFCGTLDYLSPEMLKGEEHDYKVDIWALGILTFQLATGRTPFEEQTYLGTLTRIVQESIEFPEYLSPQIKRFIKRCLQKQAKVRPSAALLLQDSFLKHCEGVRLQLV